MRGRRAIGLLLAGILVLPAASRAGRRRPSHGNPHAEISAMARVETAPRRHRHRNGRSFEELEVLLLSVKPLDSAAGSEHFLETKAGARVAFDMKNAVRLVHDLSCGGAWVELKPGDRVELRGEYVRVPSGRDIIHFTHPADGSCGAAVSHAGGFLRPAPESAAAPIPAASAELFLSSVRPILSVRCAPCHEPGGKMYARMPFDDPATVASHAARMAGRLSGDDRRALEAWAAGLPARPAP